MAMPRTPVLRDISDGVDVTSPPLLVSSPSIAVPGQVTKNKCNGPFGAAISYDVTRTRSLALVNCQLPPTTMLPLSPTPLTSLRVSQYQIPKFNFYPNTSIQHRPLLIYYECFSNPSPPAIESYLLSKGVVVPQWRYTMYNVSHFHSTTHEVLCIVSGRAKLCFGGEENPERVETIVGQGDVVIIPAGVAHKLLEELDGGFLMVGSYPVGKDWDMCYGRPDEQDKIQKIKDLGWFSRDPIYGSEGPVLHV